MKIFIFPMTRRAYSGWGSGSSWLYATWVSVILLMELIFIIVKLVALAVFWVMGKVVWKLVLVTLFLGLFKDLVLAMRTGITTAMTTIVKWGLVIGLIYWIINKF